MNNISTNETLPHLLYISDVPVESTYHGSLLLYRLFQNYPTERLQIIEGFRHEYSVNKRIPGIKYNSFSLGINRLSRTRFAPWYSIFLINIAPYMHKKIDKLLTNFIPEAIITVAHDYLWLTAAAYAKAKKIPLHLVIHDNLLIRLKPFYRKKIEKKFGEIYQQSKSRLCISPYMEERFFNLYGVKGEVLYPSRGSDSLYYSTPPTHIEYSDRKFTFAFAGSLHCTYIDAILQLAKVLKIYNGQLNIYSPLTIDQAKSFGLAQPHINLMGMLSSNELIERLHNEADALFIPMSFNDKHRTSTEVSFPSKLVDYTASGLPLFIYGPPYCSAIKWAKENYFMTEIVDSKDNHTFESAVKRLLFDVDHCKKLAKDSINAGNLFFSYETAWIKLTNSIINKKQSLKPL